MSPRKSKRDCWGYLLPTTGKLPAILPAVPIQHQDGCGLWIVEMLLEGNFDGSGKDQDYEKNYTDLKSSALELDVVTVGSDANCDVRAEQVGCTLYKRHFQVTRSQSCSQIKNISTKRIYINTNAVASGEKTELQHNALIATSSLDNPVLRYADKATSENSDFNLEIRNKYVVAHKLGQGGYGLVFLIIDKKNHKQFAMKVASQNAYSRREAAIARKLDHPCIVPIHKIFINPHKMYLVMDYMRGGDLSHWVNYRKLLTEQQMKLIFYQIALAVMHLHMEGIGHRDLKPSNILLQDNMPCTLIKVTDFGLAKQEHEHSTMKTTAGSEPYMAPEVVNSKTYTKQVDVWSMGIILFYSLCGSLPFRDVADATSKGHKVMFILKKWTGVSSAAVNLVKNMLEINPEKRIKVNKILQDEWLQDEDMKAKVDSLMGKTSEQIKVSAAVKSRQNKNENLPANHNQLVPVQTWREYIPPRGVNQFMESNRFLQRRKRNSPFWKRLNERCNIM